jgi:hypothetical protein
MYYVNLNGEVQYNEPEEEKEVNPNAAQSFIYNSNDPSQFQIPGSPPGQFVGELFYATPKVSKIMDGFFVGAQDAGVDMEFMLSNKVMGVVNCAAHIIPNSLLRYDVKYLPFRWEDRKNTIMFDPRGRDLSRIVKFIDRIRIKGGAVLITSVNGTSRAIYATLAYFVQKFDWSILKALEYVQSKRVGILLKPVFLKQLAVATLTLKGSSKSEKALLEVEGSLETFHSRWTRNCKSTLETVLQNTFVNSHPSQDEEAMLGGDKAPSTRRIGWWDGAPIQTMPKEKGFKEAVAERRLQARRASSGGLQRDEQKHAVMFAHPSTSDLTTDEKGRNPTHEGPSEQFQQELSARPHTPATPSVSPSKATRNTSTYQLQQSPTTTPSLFDLPLDGEVHTNKRDRARPHATPGPVSHAMEEDVLLESLEESYDETAELAKATASVINEAVHTHTHATHTHNQDDAAASLAEDSLFPHDGSAAEQFTKRAAQMSFPVPKQNELKVHYTVCVCVCVWVCVYVWVDRWVCLLVFHVLHHT